VRETSRTIVAERLTAQLLAGRRARDPVAVAERLLAIQGQDARGFRLAVRARSKGLTAHDVDRALREDRTLLVTWLNRGTLHLVRSEDYPWLHALTTPPLVTGARRRLVQEGLTLDEADRGVAAIERALAEEGPLTGAQLRDRLAAAGLRSQGQALYHLLFLASLRGIAVRGPVIGKQHAYALVRDWLGEPEPVDRAAALAELARRYLAGHGPATDRDLARWAGLPLRGTRAGLEAIARELRERDDGLVELKRRRPRAAVPPPRLLGAFDPVLLGWTDRTPIVGDHAAALVAGGIFRPFALVDGRAAATWTLRAGTVDLDPFATLPPDVAEALARDGADVVRFLQAERPAIAVA
jgi:hypothetical protein